MAPAGTTCEVSKHEQEGIIMIRPPSPYVKMISLGAVDVPWSKAWEARASQIYRRAPALRSTAARRRAVRRAWRETELG